MSIPPDDGFGFRERFGRERKTAKPEEPKDDSAIDAKPLEQLIPVTIYCPLRCPKCGARYPKSSTGRGKFPVHYCTCKECGLEWHAQEVDHAGLLRLVVKRAGG